MTFASKMGIHFLAVGFALSPPVLKGDLITLLDSNATTSASASASNTYGDSQTSSPPNTSDPSSTSNFATASVIDASATAQAAAGFQFLPQLVQVNTTAGAAATIARATPESADGGYNAAAESSGAVSFDFYVDTAGTMQVTGLLEGSSSVDVGDFDGNGFTDYAPGTLNRTVTLPAGDTFSIIAGCSADGGVTQDDYTPDSISETDSQQSSVGLSLSFTPIPEPAVMSAALALSMALCRRRMQVHPGSHMLTQNT